MSCIPCTLNLHEECLELGPKDEETGRYNCCCWSPGNVDSDGPLVSRVIEPGRRAEKEDSEIRDPISTGRKRAAQLKPILDGMVCEWSGLLYAGGGARPIIGCKGTILTGTKGKGAATGNIHHGPDKSTLNNSDENLHRICGTCHNRWHALNDPFYPEARLDVGAPYLPLCEVIEAHDPNTMASEDQINFSNVWWGLDPKTRESIPLRKAVQ